MYGCGSTEHGELPYLRFSGGAGDSDCDDDSLPRSEICVPTRLRLPFLQVRCSPKMPHPAGPTRAAWHHLVCLDGSCALSGSLCCARICSAIQGTGAYLKCFVSKSHSCMHVLLLNGRRSSDMSR